MIEYTFEGGHGIVKAGWSGSSSSSSSSSSDYRRLTYDEVDKADRFYEAYKMPEERLIAILENIIRNKGDFIIQVQVI